MKLKFAGITRSKIYSPTHEVNDHLIISKTADHLRNFGADVEIYSEDDLGKISIEQNVIFSMVRGAAGISELMKYSKDKLIINSPQSVVNCYRYNLLELFQKYNLAYPKSVLIETAIGVNGQLANFESEKLWVKRSDIHSIERKDVFAVSKNENEITAAFKEFTDRKIPNLMLQEHIEGDTIKFYAVRGSNLFHWYYSEKLYDTKFDTEKLKREAKRAASALGLYVYGGDAVITKQGEIIFIDLNDWPSFAPIRDEASLQIAKVIYKKGKEFSGKRKVFGKCCTAK